MDLDALKSIYFTSEHNLDEEVFLPIVKHSSSIRCMSGYFTSSVLRELAQSLFYFLSANESSIKFLISPNLDKKDLVAIDKVIDSDENLIPLLFPDFNLTEKSLQTKSLEALTYLIISNQLTLKIAIQQRGMFHTKCWLFETERGVVAIHGPANATQSGISKNFEQIAINKSWESTTSESVVDELSQKFHKIWEGEYPGLKTIVLNKKSVSFLKDVSAQLEVSNNKFKSSLIKGLIDSMDDNESQHIPQTLTIPNWLNYTSGDFAHQGEAVKAWSKNAGTGILSIATGGGKTLTSLVAATLIQSNEDSLLLVIAVPTTALLNQWAEDVRNFGVKPLNTQNIKSNQLGTKLNACIRRLKHGYSKSEVLIITHDSLKSEKTIRLIEKAAKSTQLMLVGDEVHNLGSIGFQSSASKIFKYRLGLSATFKRQFDEEGTQFLLDYFGKVVYEYGLTDAIKVCLVPFDYHVHSVSLNEDEEDEWSELTYKIKKLSYAVNLSDGTDEKERWKILCLKRRRVVENACGKVAALASNLPENSDDIKRTLIFCTDKYPRQLEAVNSLLTQRKINFHQITAEETSNKYRLAQIINSFDNDELQVLTSKRVLDEGFNIPQTEIAFLIASNTVERQWIQRLGRVLRKSPKTNKQKAIIHDFLVIPSEIDNRMDEDFKGLVRGELARIQFFDFLSQNGLEEGGTADIIELLLESLG